MRGEIIKEIEQILPAGQILRREPMSRHTTFRVGGPAELFLEIRTASEIQKLLTFFVPSKFIFLNSSYFPKCLTKAAQ